MLRILITLLIVSVPVWGQTDSTVTVSGVSATFTVDASDPLVDWTSPEHGETYLVGQSITGTWLASDEGFGAVPVTIMFSESIGSSFAIVAENLQNNSPATFSAPLTPTDYLRIAIRVRDAYGNEGWDYTQGYLKIGDGSPGEITAADSSYSVNFTVDSHPPSVELISPDGGATFAQGAVASVTWNASDNSFGATPVELAYSATIGGLVLPLGTAVDNSGSNSITIPPVDSRFGRIYVIVTDSFGNSMIDGSSDYLVFGSPAVGIDTTATVASQSENLTVDAHDPIVDLYAPNGGETFLEETIYNVSWSATDELLGVQPITISLSPSIGSFFETQAEFLDDDGIEVLTAPLGPLEYAQVRVSARDFFGNIGQDQSDGYFSVFESGNGAIQGHLLADRDISGILYLSLWLPGRDPEIDPPDRTHNPIPVNLYAGVGYLYSFSNLMPGEGYSVGAFVNSDGSTNSGNDNCDYGADLSGNTLDLEVTSDNITVGSDIPLYECENFNNGDFSLTFDGVDDYIEIPSSPLLNIDTGFTITTWIKPFSWDPDTSTYLLYKDETASQFTLGKIGDWFAFSAANESSSALMPVPPVNRWTFISAVYQNENIYIYANGILQDTEQLSGPIQSSAELVYFGGKTPGTQSSSYFNGIADDLTIWTRALDQNELLLVMDSGIDPLTEPGLAGSWNFVEGIAGVAHDESPAANHASISGAAWNNTLHAIEADIEPLIPVNITASSTDHGAVISWQRSLEYDIDKYTVFRDTALANPQQVAEVIHPASDFYDSGLNNGQSYYYWVNTVDLAGNTSPMTEPYIVVPNGKPVWATIPDTSFLEDDSLVLDLAPYVYDDSDPDQTLNISVAGGDIVLLNYNAGNFALTLSGAPDSSNLSELITVTAVDPFGLSASDSFTVFIIPVNDPPQILSPALDSPTEGYFFNYHCVGSDVDDSNLVWSFENLPSWLEADADSVFGTPYENAPDTAFTLILSDGEAADTQVVALSIIQINNFPVLTSPLTAAAREDEYFVYHASGFDPEGASLIWNFSLLPPWLTADADSIFGIPTEGFLSIEVSIILSDGELTDNFTLAIEVETINDPPVIISPGAVDAVEDIAFSYQAMAADPEDSTLTWTIEDLPTWLNSSDNIVYGTPRYQDSDTSFLCIVDDGELLDTLLVSVDYQMVNDPPVIGILVDESEKHSSFDFSLSTFDEEQDPLTKTINYSLDSVSWAMPTLEILAADNYRWLTEADFPGQFKPQIWLRYECYDGVNNSTIVSNEFSIDNHIGSLAANISTAGNEYTGPITIPFEITDSTGDGYRIIAEYSTDLGVSWQPATLGGIHENITVQNYSDSLIWESDQDLPGLNVQAELRLRPHDGWIFGNDVMIDFHLDNQLPPVLTSQVPGNNVEIDWYSSFELNFSVAIDPATVTSGIRILSADQGNLPFTYTLDSSTIMLDPIGWLVSTDSVAIELNSALLDVTGDSFDANGNGVSDQPGESIELEYYVGVLGDYDHTGSVEFDDLVTFAQSWGDTSEITDEVGPADGVPPLLQINPDADVDFEDLMVFVQMWNWSAGFENDRNQMAKTVSGNGDELTLELSYPERLSPSEAQKLVFKAVIDSAIQMGAAELILNYDTAVMELDKVHFNIGEDWVKLSHVGESRAVINIAELSSVADMNYRVPVEVVFKKKATAESSVQLLADLRGKNGEAISIIKKSIQFSTNAPVPDEFALYQNYPNPFNPITKIDYVLAKDSNVKISITNLLGQEIIVIVDTWQAAGHKSVQWNGTNSTGSEVSGGIYFLRLETESFNAVRKITLLK